jgi:hypothetical protein
VCAANKEKHGASFRDALSETPTPRNRRMQKAKSKSRFPIKIGELETRSAA